MGHKGKAVTMGSFFTLSFLSYLLPVWQKVSDFCIAATHVAVITSFSVDSVTFLKILSVIGIELQFFSLIFILLLLCL